MQALDTKGVLAWRRRWLPTRPTTSKTRCSLRPWPRASGGRWRHCTSGTHLMLLGLALRIVREKREAEDLLHDVFLEAWRSAKDFDPKRGRVRTWLAIRMRSRALDLQKSARVSRNAGDGGLELLVDEVEGSSPDHGRVRSALATLGRDQRRVLELAYFEGLSCTEIAERVAIPVGTVSSRARTTCSPRARPTTWCAGDQDCIFASRAMNGIAVGGSRAPPAKN
jgi:RNA polymerase sigma-70 factor (ECF subfamily)